MQSFERSEYILSFPCLKPHIFHKECAMKWWETKKNCPFCKKEYENADEKFF